MVQYHEWRAGWWEQRVGGTFQDRPEYLEGANAYAYRQASIRRAMRDFCKRAWQFVPAWICLGSVPATDTDPAGDDHPNGIADPSVADANAHDSTISSIPELEPVLVANVSALPSAANASADADTSSINSLPSLETVAPSSECSHEGRHHQCSIAGHLHRENDSMELPSHRTMSRLTIVTLEEEAEGDAAVSSDEED